MSLRRHAVQPLSQPTQPDVDQAPAEAQYIPATETQDLDQAVPAVQTVSNTLPAPANSGSMSAENLAQQGYEGLEFDFTSFPVISLKTNGQFEDSDGTKYGTEFHCRIHQTKEKFVYRGLLQGKVMDNKADIAYSYDQIISTRGEKIDDVIVRWKAQGKTWEQKKYLEALVEMHAPGEPYDGEFRMLSIAPTSVGRLAGFLYTCQVRLQGQHLSTQMVRVYCGEQVTKAVQPFYPWAFSKA
jgi:hypothetical protein